MGPQGQRSGLSLRILWIRTCPADFENIALVADSRAGAEIAGKTWSCENGLRTTEARGIEILSRIDEIVADGLGLTPAEHGTIRQRCQELPLSVTVERPRFAWSADRKTQARRIYRPGARFKT